MENKFKKNEQVRSKKDPEKKLTVMRHFSHIYYCRVEDEPWAKERVYFERELISEQEYNEQLNKG